MKTAELIGAQLDYWVARAEGFTLERTRDVALRTGVGAYGSWVMFDKEGARHGYIAEQGDEDRQCGDGSQFYWSPSTDFAQGGPIIDREKISTITVRNDPGVWTAMVDAYWEKGDGPSGTHEGTGPTPLIAAMRALVRAKFGPEVPERP